MPRSFLVKTMRQKSTANATNESKWQGHSHDLRDQSFPVVSYRPKTTPVQESSKTNLETGLKTLRIYPAEVTSSNFQSLETNSSTPLDLESKVGGIEEEAENASENFTASSKTDKKRVRHRCVECHRCFATISGLHKHKQFHCSSSQSRKAFACKYCDKTYVSLGALKMHIRTHTLPCQCKICGKAFSRPWLLQGHIRTHTGEKPYQCPNCQRAFADRSNLRAHLQTHSSVKKYSCTICSRSFSRMSLLLKHQYSCNDGNELS